MPVNWWMFFVAGLIPLVVGFVYYGKVGFGQKWMKLNGFTEEDLQKGNMALILGLSFLFSTFIAFTMTGVVIHQGAVFQMMMHDVLEVGSASHTQYGELMAEYGDRFRDFKHGVLHGLIMTILFVFPIIAINALFERRGWSYIMIHTGYWAICLCLIGGLLCQTLVYA